MEQAQPGILDGNSADRKPLGNLEERKRYLQRRFAQAAGEGVSLRRLVGGEYLKDQQVFLLILLAPGVWRGVSLRPRPSWPGEGLARDRAAGAARLEAWHPCVREMVWCLVQAARGEKTNQHPACRCAPALAFHLAHFQQFVKALSGTVNNAQQEAAKLARAAVHHL